MVVVSSVPVNGSKSYILCSLVEETDKQHKGKTGEYNNNDNNTLHG